MIGLYQATNVLRAIPSDDGEVRYEGYLCDTGLPPVPDPIE